MTDDTQKNTTSETPSEDPITLDEFKAWLQGVEDMQEEGWSPNELQWSKIRSKIFLVISSAPKPQVVNNAQQVRPVQHNNVVLEQPAASEFDDSGLNEIQPPRGGSGNKPAPVYSRPNGPVMDDSGASVKTPNVDTSQSDYVSSFV